jgi:hypothetical protein
VQSSQQLDSITQSLKKEFKSQSEDVKNCIENCLNCHKACEQLISYCLQKGGKHADRKHIELLLCCADICRTSAHFMMWNSDLHSRVCQVCAEVCLKCAVDCEQMSEDATMKACAELCRVCVESCQSMSRHTHH